MYTRYPKVYSWDIVNEALQSNGTMRDSFWLQNIGSDYIESAFKFAQNINPNILAVYNDYGNESGSKLDACINLIRNLKQKNIKIDAIGMQAHWQLSWPSIATIETALKRYAAEGVKIFISELDIDTNPNALAQNYLEVEDKLAARYEDIFKLFLKHHKIIDKVTFWGYSDKNSWLKKFPRVRDNYPLLFDNNNLPKKAFDAVVNAVAEYEKSTPLPTNGPQVLKYIVFDNVSLDGQIIFNQTKINGRIEFVYPK